MQVRAPLALVAIAALVSFGLSLSLWFTGNEHDAIFVGLWVPSILAAGALAAVLGGRPIKRDLTATGATVIPLDRKGDAA